MERGDRMHGDMEKTLIKKAAKGDTKSFEKLIVPYEQKVYRIAWHVFRHDEDASDAAQEVFVKLYYNLSKFRFDSSFSTWLYRLAMNTCIDEYRKRKRRLDHTAKLDYPMESDCDTPEDAVIRQEKILAVRTAISQLSDDHKSIIILRDIQGLSYEEVSEILNISLGTVKSRISRARSALKEQIISNGRL